jgi:hypothetical protein
MKNSPNRFAINTERVLLEIREEGYENDGVAAASGSGRTVGHSVDER